MARATSRRTTTATRKRPAGPAILLYDAGCGFCRWSAEWLRRWDRRRRLRLVPLHNPEARDLLTELPEARRSESWHLVDHRVRSGGAAVAPLLWLLPGGAPLALVADRFPTATDRAYRWVADHRDRIGALLGQTACAVDPSRPR
jgi:predicted DCC family thiol-disulfide oxidoreductase YuxK